MLCMMYIMKNVNRRIPQDISTDTKKYIQDILDVFASDAIQECGTYFFNRVPLSMRWKKITYNGKNQLFETFCNAKIYLASSGYYVFTVDGKLYRMKQWDKFISQDKDKLDLVIWSRNYVIFYDGINQVWWSDYHTTKK